MTTKRLYPLSDLDDIPGTTVFNAARAREAYHLHKFCMSLMDADNRIAFKDHQRAYLDRFKMSEEQKRAVLDRDFNKLIDLGGNILFPRQALQHRRLERPARRELDDRHDRGRICRNDARGRPLARWPAIDQGRQLRPMARITAGVATSHVPPLARLSIMAARRSLAGSRCSMAMNGSRPGRRPKSPTWSSSATTTMPRR